MNKKDLSILIYTTYPSDDIKDTYKLDLEESNLTEDELSFDEWFEDYKDICYNDMISNFKEFKLNDKCVILGSLGLWNGRFQIHPKVCASLEDAIKLCIGDSENVEITLSNGYFHVSSSHHDGTNSFCIHLLNKKGREIQNGDFSKSCYHRKVYSF